ncbi:MAG: hypothetical protein BGO31_12335 [Bacteroidetes bacterium 43-16]|nr:MAG: hypothetical protein BGO31_12335 [Bacteroidetes bacterium 43-16]
MKLESLSSEKFQVVPRSAMSQLVGGGDLRYEYTKPLPPSPWDNDRRGYTMDGNNKKWEAMEFKCLNEEWPAREVTGPFGMIP